MRGRHWATARPAPPSATAQCESVALNRTQTDCPQTSRSFGRPFDGSGQWRRWPKPICCSRCERSAGKLAGASSRRPWAGARALAAGLASARTAPLCLVAGAADPAPRLAKRMSTPARRRLIRPNYRRRQVVSPPPPGDLGGAIASAATQININNPIATKWRHYFGRPD